jgi:hypothetical protein
MAKVMIKRGSVTTVRIVQIVSQAPGPNCYWAYTMDDLPREPLKLRRAVSKVDGTVSYVEAYEH